MFCAVLYCKVIITESDTLVFEQDRDEMTALMQQQEMAGRIVNGSLQRKSGAAVCWSGRAAKTSRWSLNANPDGSDGRMGRKR